MNTFKAGVQYNDFTGTVAADVADNLSLSDHLIKIGAARSDERVVAFRITSNAVRPAPVTQVSLVAYLTNSPAFDPAPKELRAVDVTMTPGEALSFFKRFDLVAGRDNVDLSGTTVDGPHYE